jgi:hypothetical protein
MLPALGQGGDGDDGEIAVPARHLAERGAAGRDRKAHRGDQLISLARSREHALLEFAGGKHTGAPARAQHDLAFEQRERQRNFRGGIGVRDGAADGALVAGLEVADEGQRGRQQRQLCPVQAASSRLCVTAAPTSILPSTSWIVRTGSG